MSKIVQIAPNPKLKPAIKVQMQVLNVAGGKPIYKGENGNQLSYRTKDVESISRVPNTRVTYCAALRKDGNLETGLYDLVPNPYINSTELRRGWEYMKDKEKITRQELLEYKHNREKDYYTGAGLTMSEMVRTVQGDGKFKFYQLPESRVDLEDGATFLNLDNPIHEVNYYMLLVHPSIATSYAELENRPWCTHYVVDDDEKIERESVTLRKYNITGAYLEDLYASKDGLIQEVAKVLYIPNAHALKSKDAAYDAINKFIRLSDTNYENFIAFYKMAKDNTRKTEFVSNAMLANYVHYDVIKNRGYTYMWNELMNENGERHLFEWKSKVEVLAFLDNPLYKDQHTKLANEYQKITKNIK